MPVAHRDELDALVDEATRIAEATGDVATTVHVVLALFTTTNMARRILEEQDIDENVLIGRVDGSLAEAPGVLAQVVLHARRVAAGCGSPMAGAEHGLLAILREKHAAGRTMLLRAGGGLPTLRNRLLSEITKPVGTFRRPGRARTREGSARGHGSIRAATRPQPPIVSWTGPTWQDDRPRRLPSAVPVREATGSTVPVAESERPSPDDAPAFLRALGRDLSALARQGELVRASGRDKEVALLIDILGKRHANNPCLIGEPGVGKTTIVENLALHLAEHDASDGRGPTTLIELDLGALLIGTGVRGAFAERLKRLKDAVSGADGRVVVYIDEIHRLVGLGQGQDTSADAAHELKGVLASGAFSCIGATTPDEWRNHVESDPALCRRFTPVLVREPSTAEAMDWIGRSLSTYEQHHDVRYEPRAVKAAVELSMRYIHDRFLPDKALTLLDLAGSRARRAAKNHVSAEAIAEIVAERIDVPVARILASDRERLLSLERQLATEIVGHDAVLQRIAGVIRRNAAGFATKRPRGSFLFLGPTGVGKSETAKAIARALFGADDALIRFDLSEYSEAHSVARLVGAPPGYVGYDAGGQLTEAVRKKPVSVILFDEADKAGPDVLQVFLQILDEGCLTDGHGRRVSFAETIVILTSNFGASGADTAAVGFAAGTRAEGRARFESTILDSARRQIAPEIWGRIDERLVFLPLGVDDVREIGRRLVAASSNALFKERGISFSIDDEALETLVRRGGIDLRYGARPMRALLSQAIETPIASRILEGRLHAGEHVLVTVRPGGGLMFVTGDERVSLSQRPEEAMSMVPTKSRISRTTHRR